MNLIAIVDDDADVATATEYFIGAKCDIFTDPEVFLNSDFTKYKCVVTDWMMPNVNGGQLAQRLRDRGYTELIFLVTGQRDFIKNPELFDTILDKPPSEECMRKMKFLGFYFGGKNI